MRLLYSAVKNANFLTRYVKRVPFFNRRYTKEAPFRSKLVYKKGEGLDLGVEPPGVKLS